MIGLEPGAFVYLSPAGCDAEAEVKSSSKSHRQEGSGSEASPRFHSSTALSPTLSPLSQVHLLSLETEFCQYQKLSRRRAKCWGREPSTLPECSGSSFPNVLVCIWEDSIERNRMAEPYIKVFLKLYDDVHIATAAAGGVYYVS